MADERRDLDLLVLGEAYADVIVSAPNPRPVFGEVGRLVDSIRLTLGSSSVIFTCGAARLGLKTAFVGAVGDDVLGRYVLDAMGNRGIDVSGCIVDRARPTGVRVVLSGPADRAILSALGATPMLSAQHVPQRLVQRARHVHAGSYYLQEALRPDLPAVFHEARRRGASTSLDCSWDPRGEWRDGIDEVLAETDVFFANAQEASSITGFVDARGAAGELLRRGSRGRTGRERTVVVKLGEEGALAARDGQVAEVPSLRVKPLDTTGAGDSFDAGFVYALLRGWSLEESLRLATVCGSLAITGVGGTEAQPTPEEAIAALPRLRRN